MAKDKNKNYMVLVPKTKEKLPNAIVFDVVPTVYDGDIAVRNIYTDFINPMYSRSSVINTEAELTAIGNTLSYVFENRVLYFLQIINTNVAVKVANEYGIEPQRVFNEITKTEDVGKLVKIISSMSNYISFDNIKDSLINPLTVPHFVASMSTDIYNIAHGYMMSKIYDSYDARSYDIINKITKEYSEELTNMFNVLFDEIIQVYGPQLLRCLFADTNSEEEPAEKMNNSLELDDPKENFIRDIEAILNSASDEVETINIQELERKGIIKTEVIQGEHGPIKIHRF